MTKIVHSKRIRITGGKRLPLPWCGASAVVFALAVTAVTALPASGDEFYSNARPAARSHLSACQQAFANNMRLIAQARVKNDAQYKKDRINCEGKRDPACNKKAEKDYIARNRKIEKQQVGANEKREICGQQRNVPASTARQQGPAAPPPAPNQNGLPPGAVAKGDPDAPDAGVPGFIGSFPGTKSDYSYCYTYVLCERGAANISTLPVTNPDSVGHNSPKPGDVTVVYRKLRGTNYWVPVHFAAYQRNNIYYQRNGLSSIEVVNSKFFTDPKNYPNAKIRYVTPRPLQDVLRRAVVPRIIMPPGIKPSPR